MEMTEHGFKAMIQGYDYEMKYFHGLKGPEREIRLGGTGHIAQINTNVPAIIVFEQNGMKDERTEEYLVHAEMGEDWIDLPKFYLQNKEDDEQYVPPGHWENSFSKYIRNIIPFLIDEENKPHEIKIEGFESIEKIAKGQGNSSRVYLPAKWVGHRILCVRLD